MQERWHWFCAAWWRSVPVKLVLTGGFRKARRLPEFNFHSGRTCQGNHLRCWARAFGGEPNGRLLRQEPQRPKAARNDPVSRLPDLRRMAAIPMPEAVDHWLRKTDSETHRCFLLSGKPAHRFSQHPFLMGLHRSRSSLDREGLLKRPPRCCLGTKRERRDSPGSGS